MKTGEVVAQGDVLLVKRAKSASESFKEQPRDAFGRVVLAYGESSGHAHVLRAPGVCLLRNETTGERVLRVIDPCELLHDQGADEFVETGEHGSVPLEPGEYDVLPQWSWQGQGVQRAHD